MVADIVPVLAAVCEVDAEEANAELGNVLGALADHRGGTVDTRAFLSAVVAFREAHPFGLNQLQSGQMAREELDARAAGTA